MFTLPRTRRFVGASVTAALLGAGIMALPSTALAADAADTSNDLRSPWDTDAFRGQVQVVAGDDGTPDLLDGVVFEDLNRNSVQDEGEPGVAGVRVSNGRDVVLTDEEGRYELAVGERAQVFVTQPAGYAVPVDEDNIPQFSYIHLPAGSPELKYGGLEPTGPTPVAVNFPLVASERTAATDPLFTVASDIQIYDVEEAVLANKGSIADLAARDDYASGGVLMTGDIVGDDLSLYPYIREMTARFNGPAWALPGNHDNDFDAPDRWHAYDTYRSQFGSTYYSFDVGNVHVIMLETIDYPSDEAFYMSNLGEEQLEWLRNDLATVPEDTFVLINGHVPLLDFADAGSQRHQVAEVKEIYAAIGDRPALSIGGHTHSTENFRTGDSVGNWARAWGVESLPFPHITASAVSGDWYNGPMLEEGYPAAVERDGGVPGVVDIQFDGTSFVETLRPRGVWADETMRTSLNTPDYRVWFGQFARQRGQGHSYDRLNRVTTGDLADSWLTTNFWMGGTGDTVEVSFDGGAAVRAERTQQLQGEDVRVGAEVSDPAAVAEQVEFGGSLADRAMHIWTAPLPADLTVGTHTAQVTATDIHGRVSTQVLEFEVVEGAATVTDGDIPVTAEIPGVGDDGTPDDGEQPGAGALALSVGDGGLQLADARNAGDRLRLTGVLPQATVTDSRTDSAGWSLTGQSSDLAAEGAVVRAENLGWNPFLVEGDATPGAAVLPALSAGPGLAAPATLGSDDGGTGSDVLAADVRLEVPVDTKAGTYTGAVTLSLFPQD